MGVRKNGAFEKVFFSVFYFPFPQKNARNSATKP